MDKMESPKMKLKSPGIDPTTNINIKNSITCSNVPESLFESAAVKKHFSKFGKVQKIRLFPRRQMCIIEYDQPMSVERAVLNAGAYDGFMFEVTRTKARMRRKSKKEDDPDWLPDSDVADELSAMSETPIYRVTRQKPMELESPERSPVVKRTIKKLPIRTKPPVREKPSVAQQIVSVEPPLVVPTQTSMSTIEAAAELQQLRSKVSLTPDEQWRILDARDRILRAWGGAGSRVKIGGATIGTCPDMCPEKELLHRQAEHQTMTLETVVDSDGVMEPRRAVKQYSRSSADQEIPMCYELRPAPVLMQTCAYLLHEIADTTRQVTLADWFHFMWDRFRGIRKDITQQALCCADSIALVEMCARFHAHCAARLADLEHTQFDQKLNTDNLTKCLQTLKHMYGDVGPELKPREAEFRGYIALLNLGDANFWWEIKQLPREIQKSEPITLAMKVFNALDNNNYVRFFRLVRERATYLQACILLRYFNDVRARALARIVRAFAARGGSKYPAEELMNTLSFESIESMRSFITHYGLRFGRDETDLSIILDRNQFTEDSDPFPIARAIKLIESKRQCTVGEVIAGGKLPRYDMNSNLYTSFNKDGRLKETALIAEDQGYNTLNDSNKDVGALKSEIRRLAAGGRVFASLRPSEPAQPPKPALFSIPDVKTFNSSKPTNVFVTKVNSNNEATKSFSFKPAIPVASTDIIKKSTNKTFDANKNIFSFSKPQNTESNNIFTSKDTNNFFKVTNTNSIFTSQAVTDKGSLLAKSGNENTDPSTIFKKPDVKMTDTAKSVFSRLGDDSNNSDLSKNVFTNAVTQNSKPIFGQAKEGNATENGTPSNIFGKAVLSQTNDPKNPSVVFGSFNKTNTSNNLFTNDPQNQAKVSFAANGDISPGTLFKSAISAEGKTYSIFQSKNRGSTVADNIFSSISSDNVYGYKETNEEEEEIVKQRLEEEKIQLEMERRIQEEIKREEERKRQEEDKRKEEERKKQEELRKIEEKRRQEEEKRQEELRKKIEEKRKAELKKQAEEKERQFKERVNNESQSLVKELEDEVVNDTVRCIISEESKILKDLNSEAIRLSEEIWKELADEISHSEVKAEKMWTDKLKKKWFQIWKNQFYRNYKRRSLLEDTPVWLTERSSVEEAGRLRRSVEYAALKHMNSIHRGYKFSGELRQFASPKPYDVVEIIRSPLLKRMKAINYPYDKCFFWKVTLVSPEPTNYIARKIEAYKWILDVFSDKKAHEISETILQVKKQTWNHLMDFAVSVSIASPERKHTYSEAFDGTNGILFYTSDNDKKIEQTIDETIKQKYPYQIIPVAVILSTSMSETEKTTIEQKLVHYTETKVISCYRLFSLEHKNVHESLYAVTKIALKWLAKKCPQNPPLEVDYVKSICQRYLGNEIWYRFKSERDGRMNIVLKDLYKLVQCYNVAVDKLIDAVTNENLFNYSPFPLEFYEFLDHTSPYPKPYEFIPVNVRNSGNASAIRDLMAKLKLPNPASQFQPIDVGTMQANIRKYCNQIGWFENPEEVVCKVVAKLPTQFSEIDMPQEEFSQYFEHYDLVDFLNIIVYEKINRLHNFDNLYAIYEKNAVKQYQSMNWIFDTEVLLRMKHKVLEEDICELENFIQAKRRKIDMDSMEYLALEDSDCTMVEENIKAANESITRYSNCKEAVKQLEDQIEIERNKAIALENLLKSALANV